MKASDAKKLSDANENVGLNSECSRVLTIIFRNIEEYGRRGEYTYYHGISSKNMDLIKMISDTLFDLGYTVDYHRCLLSKYLKISWGKDDIK